MIMQPIPPEVGRLKLIVIRNSKGINKLAPEYSVMFESIKHREKQIPAILYAKKSIFKNQAYYLLSSQTIKSQMFSNEQIYSANTLGKLKSI